jgi:PPOX class probable F420-dependent enzyme
MRAPLNLDQELRMSVEIPASHKDLLGRALCATLATLMPGGAPQLTLVWFDHDGTHLRIPTTAGRRKVENMRQRPEVSLLVVDPGNSNRYIEVRGVVDEITEEGAMEHLQAVTLAYTGQPSFYGSVAPRELEGKETRVVVKIRPTRVYTFGNGVELKDQSPDLDAYRR